MRHRNGSYYIGNNSIGQDDIYAYMAALPGVTYYKAENEDYIMSEPDDEEDKNEYYEPEEEEDIESKEEEDFEQESEYEPEEDKLNLKHDLFPNEFKPTYNYSKNKKCNIFLLIYHYIMFILWIIVLNCFYHYIKYKLKLK